MCLIVGGKTFATDGVERYERYNKISKNVLPKLIKKSYYHEHSCHEMRLEILIKNSWKGPIKK